MVLSLGLIRVHPLLAVGLNLVAVGGLAPTVWGWRTTPVLAVVRAGRRRRGRRRLDRAAGAGAAGAERVGLAVAAGAHPEQHVLPRRDGRPAACACGSAAGAAARRLAARFGLPVGRCRSPAAGSRARRSRAGRPARPAAAARSKFGSISSLAASSNAVTVPPCAPGVNRKCATLSDRPAFQAICTVQRPSSLRQASQLVASGSRPRATSAVVTVSSSVSTAGPSASTGCAAVASSAARERSSRTGWANRSTRAMSTPAAAATCSTDAPARIRA